MSKILGLLVALAFYSDARAQFLWHVSHAAKDWRYVYSFTSLSCAEGDCTAAGLTIDNLKDQIKIVLWRSSDGGMNWQLQDPGLPWELGQNQNKFYAIDQIDQYNVVAVGDSGLIVRTFDGGKTWKKQDCKSTKFLYNVHFANRMEGIISSYDSEGTIFITSDGGNSWNGVLTHHPNLRECHAFGGRKFCVFQEGEGRVYNTENSWSTFTANSPIIDSASDKHYADYYFKHAKFGSNKTFIAYGNYLGRDGLIARSLDEGAHWEKPVIFTNKQLSDIYYMTEVEQDTILAGGFGINRFAHSWDHGSTWDADSLQLDTNYAATFCFGLESAGGDRFVAAFSSGPSVGGDGILIQRGLSNLKVGPRELTQTPCVVFPNPAVEELRVNCDRLVNSIELIDPLGRILLEKSVPQTRQIILNVKMVARGAYFLKILLRNGLVPIFIRVVLIDA